MRTEFLNALLALCRGPPVLEFRVVSWTARWSEFIFRGCNFLQIWELLLSRFERTDQSSARVALQGRFIASFSGFGPLSFPARAEFWKVCLF